MIIPALAPTLDGSLKEDRTLCPIRALLYYLDKTKDLRKGKDLVFVSFKMSFAKYIIVATYIFLDHADTTFEQTVLLNYQVSDEAAQRLHQVQAHDVRIFAASKTFQ